VLDAFAAASPFGAALLDGDDPFTARIIEANPALAAVALGGEPGQVFGELIEPSSRLDAAMRIADAAHGHAPLEVRLAKDPSRIAHLYLSQSPGRWVVYLVDVSEQKQVELQLSQSQKMQAIGQLAGGVAHDFNNLLTAILMQLDVLATRHPVGDPSYEGLNEIKQTSMRAADLVRKLLTFSRKQTVQREILDLGELISEFEVLLRRVLYEDVKLTTDYGRNLPAVRADRGQLETAVMNLAVNARDAMVGGGSLILETAEVDLDERYSRKHHGARPGPHVMLSVSDTGHGMDAEILSQIFEPFFTTKPQGQGTGLGLSMVYGIIEQSGGHIEVESTVGSGTTFRVLLPLCQESWIPDAPAGGDLRTPAATATLLLVEDEPTVRELAYEILAANGYDVITAADGREALETARRHADRIRLVITDIVMPQMGGLELVEGLAGVLPDAPVLFMSGYSESAVRGEPRFALGAGFLQKPFTPADLLRHAREALEGARRPRS